MQLHACSWMVSWTASPLLTIGGRSCLVKWNVDSWKLNGGILGTMENVVIRRRRDGHFGWRFQNAVGLLHLPGGVGVALWVKRRFRLVCVSGLSSCCCSAVTCGCCCCCCRSVTVEVIVRSQVRFFAIYIEGVCCR